jgi:hypothetical protein
MTLKILMVVLIVKKVDLEVRKAKVLSIQYVNIAISRLLLYGMPLLLI